MSKPIPAVNLNLKHEACEGMNKRTIFANMGNKQSKLFPRSYDSQRNYLLWSTVEILDEQRDSKGNQKYFAIRNPNNAYYDENNNKDNHESNC